MKRILCVFVFLAACIGSASGQEAQFNYKVTVKATGQGGASAACASNFNITFGLSSGDLKFGSMVKGTYADSSMKSFKATENLNNFDVYGQNQTYQGPVSGCVGATTKQSYTDILNVYQRTHYFSRQYPIPNFPGNYATVTIFPENLWLTDTSRVESFLEDAKVNFPATPGFPADAYTWKYQIVGETGWINFPLGQGQSLVSLTGKEMLGSNFQTYAAKGSKVHVAVFFKNENGKESFLGSGRILFPKLYAPRIVSAIAQKTKCFESTTSSVLIKLDKKIGAGRQLEILNAILTSDSPITITDDDLNINNEYELIDLDINKSFSCNIRRYNKADGTSLLSNYYIDETKYSYTTNLIALKLNGQVTKTDVRCYGGADGNVTARFQGGTSPYTITYTSKSGGVAPSVHTLNNSDLTKYVTDPNPFGNLPQGQYKVSVQDKNGCPFKDSVSISQPAALLVISNKSNTDATGYGLSNGTIQVKINGGTIAPAATLAQGYMPPVLKDTKGNTFTGVYVSRLNEVVTYHFTGLAANTYQLRAADIVIYNTYIRDSTGCLAKDVFVINQPPPLVTGLKQKAGILCYAAQTAKLSSIVTGGVPLGSGKPYTYQWSYSVNGTIAYNSLGNTDSVLANTGAGFYKLLVTDKNNNQSSAIYQVKQPAQITSSQTIKNVTCLNWTDGAISIANIQGGVKPYAISWENKSSLPKRDTLAAGSYVLSIHDSLNCAITKTLKVKDTLNGIDIIQKRMKLPQCYNYSDGELSIVLKVDSPPYTIKWNTGSTDTLLTKLAAADYTVQVSDSKNCLKEAVFKLPNPTGLYIWLGEDRYLCKGQKADFDITVPDSNYTYQWFGQYEGKTPKISVTEDGRYTAKITNQNGCSVSQTINIYKVNQTIKSDFVVATHVFAGEEVSVVNITHPEYADTSYWEINTSKIKVKDMGFEYATVVFPDTGVYEIGLRSVQDKCVKLLTKQVKVLQPTFDQKIYNGASSFIEEFEISPNPNDGKFAVKVKLQDNASVKLKFMDLISKAVLTEVQQNDAREYNIPMQVYVASGTYILFLETPYGTRVLKVIILD